jgi:hypothetical protein
LTEQGLVLYLWLACESSVTSNGQSNNVLLED